MLASIVRGSLANPRIVTALSLLVALLGVGALLNARLDVFPDFAPPHLLVQAEARGLDATQVESLVTRPLEDLLAGAENVAVVRSTSSQGLAAIQVVFGRGSDPFLQRQVISERLADASALLPAGVGPPLLSPLSSSMEYLLHFGFTSERLSPLELRDLIRWNIKPQILAVPGVAQAQLFGGDSRERQLWIDPLKLDASGVTLEEVFEAARRGTQITGGGYLETATQRLVLQAQAPGDSLGALEQAVVANRAGVPLRIGDIAQVRDGPAPRFGDAIIGGQPGILVETSTQYGANTLDVTRELEHRLQTLAPELAQRGVQYHPALLRPASFIESAIAKLRNSLLIGALLVIVLLLVTLRDWRGALISFSAIPVSLLATVWILSSGGLSLNTMSLGGLVVALGVVVDDAIIDVENITRRRRTAGYGRELGRAVAERLARGQAPGVLCHRGGGSGLPADRDAVGSAGGLLPAAGRGVPAGGRIVAAGCDERDPGVVCAADARLRPARGARLVAPLQALAALGNHPSRTACAAGAGRSAAERRRRPCAAAAARRAAAAGLSRELPDCACRAAARDLSAGDLACRAAHRAAPGGHSRRQERSRTDRPGGKRSGSGCPEQERVRDSTRPCAR